MKTEKTHLPPKWAERVLEWYCRPGVLEDLQGDLHEFFDRNLENKGPFRAKVNYVIDVVKFMRPYTVKKLEILDNITTFIMFKNYFKTSIRSIGRNKLFSAINVIGLAISMSVCLLMISFLSEVFSYDNFHVDKDRMYRIMTSNQFLQEDPSDFASTSVLVGKRLQEEVPGIESSVIMRRNFGGDAKIGDKTIPISGIWAGEGFFDVFKAFPLIQGNPETALKEPYSIVLTEEAAVKLFGDEDPMGKIIQLRSENSYTVTGIVQKPPHNSHFTFETLGSFITYENERKKNSTGNYWISWNDIWSNYVYMVLEPNTSASQVNAALKAIQDEENAKNDRVNNYVKLQSIGAIMPGPDLSNNIGKSMNTSILWLLSGLTFIVILCAGFNYTNLSIARSLRRAKEVGVRKVVGASRKQVFSQFIVEAIIISLISLVFATLLFYVIKPEFLNLDGEIQEVAKIQTTPTLFIYFFVFSIVIGIMAGFFPAVFLSKLKAVKVLKDAGSTTLFKKINMRKVLIVVQFTLSLAFIISATIGYRQYKYALAFDLGFKTENVLNVRLSGNDANTVANAFRSIPEVTEISKSLMIPSIGNRYGNTLKYDDPMDSVTLYYNIIDENYIPLMDHDLVAGTNFESRPEQEKEEVIIVNEQVLKRFNIGTPDEAIGKQIQLGGGTNGNKVRIIGVVKDFHYAKISDGIKSFGFRYRPGEYDYLNLKINTNDIVGTMDKLKSAWLDIDDVHEFSAMFYDERIERAYSEFSVMFTIVGFLAFITISLAALGLLGMAVYTAETRLKEISIRKVLGATEGSLIKLLARGFMWLLIIAALIAVPATYFLFDSVVLAQSVNRISIGIIELMSGVVVIFAIGFLTIGSQTLKAAKSNPAETLRTE